MKILLVEGRFYNDLADLLVAGATKKLEELGVEYEKLQVPGVLEIPAAINFAHKSSNNYDGFVALGCVIRGETTHYDYVCEESARALMDLSLNEQLAIGNAIITVENMEQAIARADETKKDKGGFAANACVEMANIKKKFNL